MLAFQCGPTRGHAETDDRPKPSFAFDPEAEKFVAEYRREELVKDEVFVAALQKLAKADLTPAAKSDAFTLMQERIGWLFAGCARLFPGRGYAQTQAMILTTFFQYQQKMPPGLDVAPLLELARTARNAHPFRSSNSLMLATILNRDAAKGAVVKAIDAEAIAASEVPAIDLHNLAMTAALTTDPKVVAQVVALLPGIESEESREDLIAATIIYKVDELRDAIEAFVRRSFPASFDNSVQTALIVLAREGPTEHFHDFYKSLGELTKDKEDIAKLGKLWDSGFRDRLQSDDPAKSPLKIWDDFTIRPEEKGAWITYQETFCYWKSFE